MSIVTIQNCTKPDLALIARMSAGMRSLTEELNLIFPQRTGVISQLAFALTMREHVMVWGDTGTAKSLLARATFGAFTGSNTFEINLSKFSTKPEVFGGINTKLMTEEGRVRYWLDEGAVYCDFFFPDEFLDASDPMLRAMLTLLNERLFLNGKERVVSRLHTSLATTNGDPWARAKANPDLKAVVDRFLFKSQVAYLDEDEEYARMLTTYLSGLRPQTQMDMADLTAFSEIVANTNLIHNPVMVKAYIDAMNAFRKASGAFISDRTMARMTQVIEAQALLFGRFEVIPEDILAVKYGVCDGEDTEKQVTFVTAATPAIKKAEKEMGASIDDAQQALIKEYAGQIPALRQEDLSKMQPNDMVATARDLTQLRAKISAVVPQTTTTQVQRDALLEKVDKKLGQLNKVIFKS